MIRWCSVKSGSEFTYPVMRRMRSIASSDPKWRRTARNTFAAHNAAARVASSADTSLGTLPLLTS